MRWLLIAPFVASAACGAPPGATPEADRNATPEAARKACVRHLELGFWKGFEGSLREKGVALDDAMRAEADKHLAETLASDEAKAEIAECVESYTRMATMAQVECIAAAKTDDEAKGCVK